MPYMNPYLPQQSQYAPYQPQGYMTAGTSPMLAQQQQQPVHGFVYVCKVKEMQSTQDAEATEYVTRDELAEARELLARMEAVDWDMTYVLTMQD